MIFPRFALLSTVAALSLGTLVTALEAFAAHPVCNCASSIQYNDVCYDNLKAAFIATGMPRNDTGFKSLNEIGTTSKHTEIDAAVIFSDLATNVTDTSVRVTRTTVRIYPEMHTIYVCRNITVDQVILFNTSITLRGESCNLNNERALISANFESNKAAMLQSTNPITQTIVLQNLEITSPANYKVAFLHALGSEFESGAQQINLSLSNMYIHDMESEAPGVGIFLGAAEHVSIDQDCVFANLSVESEAADRYVGGPAISIVNLWMGGSLHIDGAHFLGNSARFLGINGTRHALGGAIYLDWMDGPVNISRAVFDGNQANQGGAIAIQALCNTLVDTSTYINNVARDDGFGSRFGALGSIKLCEGASMSLLGNYTNNISEGRGGVVGTNIHERGSKLVLNGVFVGNTAKRGGVWGAWSETDYLGETIIEPTSVFLDNTSIDDSNATDLLHISQIPASLSTEGWAGRAATINRYGIEIGN